MPCSCARSALHSRKGAFTSIIQESPGAPAGGFQVVRRGAERIGCGADEVAAAVAVEVYGEALVSGRDELGLPERAGPGAVQLVELQVAAFNELERRDQLAAPEFLALAAFAHKRCKGMRQETVAGLAAVIGLHAPDRGDDMAVDAEALLGGPQGAVILAHHSLAVADPLLVNEKAQVVPDGRLEFRLYLGKAQHLLVRLRNVERLRDHRLADTGTDSRVTQSGYAGLEARRSRSGHNAETAAKRMATRIDRSPCRSLGSGSA
jgi:hypothetical protein